MRKKDLMEGFINLQRSKIEVLESRVSAIEHHVSDLETSNDLDSLRIKALEKLLRDNNIPFDNLVYNVKKDEVDINE